MKTSTKNWDRRGKILLQPRYTMYYISVVLLDNADNANALTIPLNNSANSNSTITGKERVHNDH